MLDDDTYRSRATASYVTGSHNAKIGFEGAYFAEKIRPTRSTTCGSSYHYGTPDAARVSRPRRLARQPLPVRQHDAAVREPPTRPTPSGVREPIGFDMNTGVGTADERVWFGALYVQDQWTLNRFTINGALRYDHAESRYGETCIGPDRFVPVQADGTNRWCSAPANGVQLQRHHAALGRRVGRVRHRQDVDQVATWASTCRPRALAAFTPTTTRRAARRTS